MASALEIKIVFCGSDNTFVHTIELSMVDAGSTTTLGVLGRVNDVKYDVPPTNGVVLLVMILILTPTKVRSVESIDMELSGDDDNDDCAGDGDGDGDGDADEAVHWVQLVSLSFSGN